MSSENVVPPKTSNRPGSRLKRAREDRGWDIPGTAEKLHVIPRYVRAIEEGDYGQLPGLVFLKGYVRSYARLVNLSEDRLIEDLEQELLMSSDPMIEPAAAAITPVGFSENNEKSGRKWLIPVVLVALVGIGYYAWQSFNGMSKDDTSASLTPEAQESPVEPVSKPAIESGMDSDAIPIAESSTGVALEEETLVEPVEVQAQMPDAEAVAVVKDTEDSLSVPPAENQSAAMEEQSATISEADFTENQVGGPGADENAVDPAQVVVKAVFSGDCWFDLRDRDNSRTVGLYRSGDVVDFSGHFPLRFVVGAVNAVSIEVNGESLDFSQYRVRNNRVELVLEQ